MDGAVLRPQPHRRLFQRWRISLSGSVCTAADTVKTGRECCCGSYSIIYTCDIRGAIYTLSRPQLTYSGSEPEFVNV
jgi:hypothetical protein